MTKKRLVICLMGPTASGKTDLAVALVNALPLDIISVDSAMVYRDMNIGTAKPSAEQLRLAPHRLIDLCDPQTPYSAGRFYRDAIEEIKKIHDQNRIPLLVGGTMLYFHLLQHGFSDLPAADKITREKIQKAAQCEGWEKLHAQLKEIDPLAAAQIQPLDAQRIQRALEVYMTTGQPLSEYQALQRMPALPYHFINIILAPANRADLHQRIEKRFDHLLKRGLVAEVEKLYARGDLNLELPALRTVGYRQVWQYLMGEYDYATMRYKAIVATRQLAKRQFTWLRRWTDAPWFDSEEKNMINQVLSYLAQQGVNA